VSDYAAIGPYALALMVVTAIPTALVSSLTVLRLSREPRSRTEMS
jgi:hypothetical protein